MDPCRSFRFEDNILDVNAMRLSRNGQDVALEPRIFHLLEYLIRNRERVLTKDEIFRAIWKDVNVTDNALTRAIAQIRKALNDDPKNPRFIQTVPTVGYRFVAEVSVLEMPPTPTLVDALGMEEPQTQPLVDRRKFWRVTVLIAGVVLLSLLGRFAVRRFLVTAPIRSLAVLPLQSLSDDPDQEYFADGMTEELITNLAYARSLRVLSRASTVGYKNSRLSVPQIAEQLKVDAVIEGTVLRVNHTIRITIRLTEAKPERQIWAASYERDSDDAITLQNQIAAEVVAQIQAQLTPEERTRLSLKGRVDPEAYDEYLRARFFLDQETDQKHKAIPHLERAIHIDPNFAAAYALLGEAWGLQGVWGGMSNRQTSAIALQYSQKAVSLDPASSEAFASLGHSLMQSHRWNEGEVALRRAVALDPNNPYALQYLAQVLVQKGRVDESVRISHDIAMSDPVSLDFQRTYADMLYRARRYDDAIAQCQRILDLDPNHEATYTTLANALLEKGRYGEAQAAFVKGHFMNAGVQAWVDVREGNTAGAQQILKANPSLVNVHTAVAHYLLGDQEAGLSQLDYLANEQWAVKTYHLRNDPTFDPMRSDPRFNAIVKKSGLLDN